MGILCILHGIPRFSWWRTWKKMVRLKRKKQYIFLILVSIFTVMTADKAFADEKEQTGKNTEVTNDSLTNAEKEKKELESALKEAQSLISDLQNSKEDTQAKIQELDTKMSAISKQVNQLQSKLEAKSTEISDTQALLVQSREDAAVQYDSMKLRIQYMYENTSNSNYMQILLSAKSISAFLNSADYIYEISEYDRQMLEQYQNTTQIIADAKSQLEQDYADLETMQAQLDDQKAAIEVLKTQKEQELASIGKDLSTAEGEAQTYESELQAQEEVISEIKTQLALQKQREEQRKVEEQRKKQEAEAQNSAETDSAQPGETGNSDPPIYTGGVFTWPCPSSNRVTSDYGNRLSPTAGASSSHKGIDIGAAAGADIVAAAQGEVIYADYSAAAGNHVIISHGNGLCTVYMHASTLNVSVGDYVDAGQIIAKVGSTGISTGNHLHFGVSLNGTYVNPWNYL